MTDYETNTRKNDKSLPLQLKKGIESMSGFNMDDVIVHYNSSKPAQMKALAYTQGTDIHVGPGQEKHLGHEAWHVVQQKQGRVAPTAQLKGININTDDALEHEADVMGARASIFSMPDVPVVQRKKTNVQQDAPMQFGRKKKKKKKKKGKGKGKGKGTPSEPAQFGGGSADSTTTNPTSESSIAVAKPNETETITTNSGVTIVRRKKPTTTQETGGSAVSTTTNPTFGTSAAAKAPGVTPAKPQQSTTGGTGVSEGSKTTNPPQTFTTWADVKQRQVVRELTGSGIDIGVLQSDESKNAISGSIKSAQDIANDFSLLVKRYPDRDKKTLFSQSLDPKSKVSKELEEIHKHDKEEKEAEKKYDEVVEKLENCTEVFKLIGSDEFKDKFKDEIYRSTKSSEEIANDFCILANHHKTNLIDLFTASLRTSTSTLDQLDQLDKEEQEKIKKDVGKFRGNLSDDDLKNIERGDRNVAVAYIDIPEYNESKIKISSISGTMSRNEAEEKYGTDYGKIFKGADSKTAFCYDRKKPKETKKKVEYNKLETFKDSHDRNGDSEYKILDKLDRYFQKNYITPSDGNITLFTERPCCESCTDVIAQFCSRYPNITIKIVHNNKHKIPKETAAATPKDTVAPK